MILKKFLRAFPGSAFATLIETDTSEICVLKMAGAGNSGQSLIAEFVVNHATSLAGGPVPRFFPSSSPRIFRGSSVPTSSTIVRKSIGTNLGIRYLQASIPREWLSAIGMSAEDVLRALQNRH